MDSKTKKNYWALKPYWCQPWSIITSGILAIAFTWIFLNSIIITLILGTLVFVWWLVFLILAPNLYEKSFEKK